MTETSNVLLVTYLFPPSGGVGVPRAIGYARYLPQNGCKVVVLTPTRPSTAYYDPELQRLVPPETSVFRAFNPELPYWLKDSIWRRLAKRDRKPDAKGRSSGMRSALTRPIRAAIQKIAFPDIQSTWGPFAIRAGRKLIRKHNIDTVIVNAPPYSLLRIGVALKREFPHLKLITDLRDDWLGYYAAKGDGPSDYDSGWSQREWQRAGELERTAFEMSNYVSIATPTWVETLRRRYTDLAPEKFICTTNGYEPDLFKISPAEPRRDGKLVITYFGTLNASRVYSPKKYLEALDSLPQDIRSRIETRLVGRVTADCDPFLAGREDVRRFGFQTKAKGVEFLAKSDYLLLIATNPASHAGKLFEYMATGKPIIALCPKESEIASILRETRTGYSVDPWNHDAIADLLLTCYRQSQQGISSIDADWTAVRQYAWPEIIRRFVHNVGLSSVELFSEA